MPQHELPPNTCTELRSTPMKFLFHYAHSFLPFRLPELNALLTMCGVEPSSAYNEATAAADLERPFLVLDLPSVEVAGRVAGRGILINSAYEVWGDGETYEACVAHVKRTLRRGGIAFEEEKDKEVQGSDTAEPPAEPLMAASASLAKLEEADGQADGASPALPKHFAENSSWSMGVEGFGRKFPMARQQEMRARFAWMPFAGPVRLKQPDVALLIMEEVGLSQAEQAAALPKRVFLLREVGSSVDRLSARDSDTDVVQSRRVLLSRLGVRALLRLQLGEALSPI